MEEQALQLVVLVFVHLEVFSDEVLHRLVFHFIPDQINKITYKTLVACVAVNLISIIRYCLQIHSISYSELMYYYDFGRCTQLRMRGG